MSKRQAFSPGEYLADEIEARGWSQSDLARIIGRPFTAVHLLIRGKRRLSTETAVDLAAALGTSVEMWLNLQAAWDAYNAPKPDPDIAKRAAKLALAGAGT